MNSKEFIARLVFETNSGNIDWREYRLGTPAVPCYRFSRGDQTVELGVRGAEFARGQSPYFARISGFSDKSALVISDDSTQGAVRGLYDTVETFEKNRLKEQEERDLLAIDSHILLEPEQELGEEVGQIFN